MGLDMYAWKTKAKDLEDGQERLADWRKHNRLHGYMEELWESKGRPFDTDEQNPMGSNFNCIPLQYENPSGNIVYVPEEKRIIENESSKIENFVRGEFNVFKRAINMVIHIQDNSQVVG